MNITIVTNQKGEILGTSQHTTTTGTGAAPKDGGIIPLEGQLVHEVEVPANLAEPESIIKLHETHIVDLFGKTAKLVERKSVKK
jgi:hypothetical protein